MFLVFGFIFIAIVGGHQVDVYANPMIVQRIIISGNRVMHGPYKSLRHLRHNIISRCHKSCKKAVPEHRKARRYGQTLTRKSNRARARGLNLCRRTCRR